MALRRGKTDPPVKTRAMTASAARMKVDKRVSSGRAVPKVEQWQERAYSYYRSVPELGDGVGFLGNACARIRFYGAVLDEEGQPRPVNEEEDGAAVANSVAETMALLGEGPAQSAVTRPLAVNLELAGMAYLQGVIDPETGDETIRVRSVSEVDDVDGRIAVKDSPSATPVPLDEATSPTFDKVWRPDPQYAALPDSPMTRLLDVCEELLLLSQSERAGDRSRLARSGIVFVDGRVQVPPASPEDERSMPQRLLDMTVEAATAAISNEGSAAAAVPIFVEVEPPGDRPVKDLIFHQTFDRPADATTLERRDKLIRRIGYGLDIPPDVITGMKDVKYSNAIQIDKSTFRHHVEPFAVIMADALTVAILRPGLLADGIAPDLLRKVFVWYDPTELVSEPDQGEPAQKVHEAGELGGRALRRMNGISEDDAPTPAERVLRLAEKMRLDPATAQAVIAAVASGQLDVEALDGVQLELPPPADVPVDGQVVDGEVTDAVTAAANLGVVRLWELVDLDRDVRTRLHADCEQTIATALRKAGARLASSAQDDPSAKTLAASVTREQLPSTLGPALAASLVARRAVQELTDPSPTVLASLAAEELLKGALDDLRSRASVLLSSAQIRAAEIAADLAGLPHRVASSDQLDAWVTAAIDFLTFAITGLLQDRLFATSDVTASTPVSVPRAAVAYAAGLPEGHGGFRGDGLPLTAGDGGIGLATGRITTDTFSAAGWALREYEWNYGITAQAARFEPHYRLNGLRFSSFTDDQLINPDRFPPEPFYVAGDHVGCACDVIPIYTASSGMSGTPDEPNLGPDQPVYSPPMAASVRAS